MFRRFNAKREWEWHDGELHQALSVEVAYKKLGLDWCITSRFVSQQDGSQLLIELERFAEVLKVKASPRAYRQSFTRNYKKLFKDDGRQYRFELLQAMLQGCPPMQINGNRYPLSARVIELSRKPLTQLEYLYGLVDRFGCMNRRGEGKAAGEITGQPKAGKTEMRGLLDEFDRSWADFECQYIKELIHMETQGRNPLKSAVEYAKSIPAKKEDCGYAHWCASLETCRPQQAMLFGRIAELNVMANIARKGRGDLNADVLRVAADVLTSRSGYADASYLVRSVCEDLLESFDAMCKYLCSVGGVMESVDPILRNNAGLVERLADLEEAWEMVARYVGDTDMRCTLDSVFSTLTSTQELEPTFRQMCSDCDVELFLVVPRITLLDFLMDPTKDALMKTLLPHVFEDNETGGGRLQSLVDKFDAICLQDFAFADSAIRQAVHGPGATANNEFIPKERQDITSGFMRDLEGWSMELQRRQARDWNAVCAVLVQHLSSDDYRKDRQTMSGV